IALPNQEGCVGLRDYYSWNTASIVRHLWNLFARSGSLWVAWMCMNRIKGCSIWDLNGSLESWT
ncbi:hypothetical protein LINPERPRIM_LOCUS37969, partial [Linum perenne]